MPTIRNLAILGVSLAILVSREARGQTADDFRAKLDAAIKRRDTSAPGLGKMRSLIINDNQAVRQGLYPAPPPAPMPQPSPPLAPPPTAALNMTINFDFASAKLSNPANPDLARLAEAMADPKYSPYLFIVVGHTDAKGSDAYNRALSRKRADSVVAFLVSNSVPDDRLIAIGRGKTQLLDPHHPDSEVNRRVEVLVMERAEKTK